MRKFIILLLIGLVGGGAFYYTKYLRAEVPPNFRTAKAKRGELLLTISATGTLEPEEVVDVGAQVMGRIKILGPDPRAATDPKYSGKHVDYNTEVEAGCLLAQIDPSLYQATFDQAQAGFLRAEADLLQMEAKLAQTDAEFKRAQRLRNVKLSSVSGLGRSEGMPPSPTTIKGISDADFIMAEANYKVAKANLEVGKAAVAQQEAMLFSAKTNLDYTTIKSPVDGTIIDRRVNIGQTVVASLNAPSLFLIAKDLRRMEIWTAVNEADIGQLRTGMPVNFNVDAFPGETFRGNISQIRLNAEMQNHVVIYRVLVATDNSNLRLLPYLSAHVKFEVDRRENALLVPNAALRYTPRAELIVAAPNGAEDSAREIAAEDVAEIRTADEASSESVNSESASPETGSSETGSSETGSSETGSSETAKATADPAAPEAKSAETQVVQPKEVSKQATEDDEDANVRRVWVRQGNAVYPVSVLIGLSDGVQTEILDGELEPGMELVLGEEVAEVVTETTNPLAPPKLRGKRKENK